jgi:hypothetical protein
MPVYMVGYDLHEGEDYSDLEKAISNLAEGSAWHCLDSTWIIVNRGPASAIRDALLPHLLRPNDQATSTRRRGDELLVATLTREAAWTKSFPDNCQEWLRTNLSKP